ARCSASRAPTCWIPPGAGGKSGVTRRTRNSDQLPASNPVEPQPECQQRPDRIASVRVPSPMLGDERRGLVPVEPALGEGAPLGQLAIAERRQRAQQPVRSRRTQGGV